MCGIAGFITKERKRAWLVHMIYKEILMDSVRRGHDATGIAATMGNGEIIVSKQPLPSPLFVHKSDYQDIIDRNPVTVIGHTRAWVKGDPSDNNNNHPITSGNIIGVHNGVIRNDEDLTQQFKLPRNAAVDSEVIFALLNKLGPINKANIQRVLDLLDGAYALAFQETDKPEKVWLVRGPGRPLAVGYDTRLRTAWFASELRFIVDAYRFLHVSKAGLYIRDMSENEIVYLDGRVRHGL